MRASQLVTTHNNESPIDLSPQFHKCLLVPLRRGTLHHGQNVRLHQVLPDQLRVSQLFQRGTEHVQHGVIHSRLETGDRPLQPVPLRGTGELVLTGAHFQRVIQSLYNPNIKLHSYWLTTDPTCGYSLAIATRMSNTASPSGLSRTATS